MASDFELAERSDIMREYANSVSAGYFHYMQKHKIPNEENGKESLFKMLQRSASELQNAAFRKCKTFDDLKVLEGKVTMLRDILRWLEGNDNE
jgi:hypothetical protein